MRNKKIINVMVTFLLVILIRDVTSYRELMKEPTYLEAQVGSFIIFDCELEFPTERVVPYYLNWVKDGNKVFSWFQGELSASENFLGRITLVDNHPNYGKGSMNLTSIRETDGGWYECRVIFPNRTPTTLNNGTWFYLTIDGGALIRIPPINATVMEGEKALLKCAMKYPDISTITWLKDGKDILAMKDLTNRAVLDSDGSLLITSTIMSDIGEYECIVKDYQDESQSAKAFLNVQYKAKVIYSPPEVYFSFGKPEILNCHFRANPPLLNLRWEKDGFLYEASNVPGVYLHRNGSLYFTSADESHAGQYSCTPYNELGTDGSSALIKVIVQHPPWFTIKPNPTYFNKVGGVVVLHCDAQDKNHQRRPDIIWSKKDGSPLALDRTSFDGGNMTIENIQASDAGVYKCSAQNEAATVSAETELILSNVQPRPPYNLSAVSNETSITLRWQAGAPSRCKKYTVWYRFTDAQEWRTVRADYGTETETTLHNLETGREYVMMVLCQDFNEDGMFSKTFTYFTKPRNYRYDSESIREVQGFESFTQVGPPRNLTIEEIDEGFSVKWIAPVYGKDSLKIYVLRWYIEPEHRLLGSVETVAQYYIVTDLEEDEVYSFQVIALAMDNYEAPSEPYELYIPPIRRKRAIAIGTFAGLVFVVVALIIFLYSKRRWFVKAKANENPNIKV